MNEILTAEEVAGMLRISKRQVYQLAKENSENPIPRASGFARLCASAEAILMGGLPGWYGKPREAGPFGVSSFSVIASRGKPRSLRATSRCSS